MGASQSYERAGQNQGRSQMLPLTGIKEVADRFGTTDYAHSESSISQSRLKEPHAGQKRRQVILEANCKEKHGCVSGRWLELWWHIRCGSAGKNSTGGDWKFQLSVSTSPFSWTGVKDYQSKKVRVDQTGENQYNFDSPSIQNSTFSVDWKCLLLAERRNKILRSFFLPH